MKWNEVPDGASLAISKKAAMQMRGGGPKTFFTGMACGAVAVLVLQGGSADDQNNKDKPNKPAPTVSEKSEDKNSN